MTTLDQARSLSARDRQLLREVKRAIANLAPTADVLLYGSVARGEHGPDSDYDILVLTDQPLCRQEEDAVEDAVYDVQLAHGTLISTLFYTKAEWSTPVTTALPLYRAIQKDAILI